MFIIESMYKSVEENGLIVLDSHLILEDNKKMRGVIKYIEVKIYKKHRIFEKKL